MGFATPVIGRCYGRFAYSFGRCRGREPLDFTLAFFWPALFQSLVLAGRKPKVPGAKLRAAGCDEYVPEPYSPRQLLAKIRQYLS
jgi:CheY-like chemotaxis protein